MRWNRLVTWSLSMGLAWALVMLAPEANAQCTTSQPPVTINDCANPPSPLSPGCPIVIDTDAFCGAQIIVDDNPSTFAKTTVTVEDGALFGEGSDQALTAPQALHVRGKSEVSIEGGELKGRVLFDGKSISTVNGGSLSGDVEAVGRSFLTINGGSLGDDIQGSGNSQIELFGIDAFGGFLEFLDGTGTARTWLRIFGDDFIVDDEDVGSGDLAPLSGVLEGELDGSNFSLFTEFRRNPAVKITLVTSSPLPPNSDADAILDPLDNCPNTSNLSQLDTDLDWIGDACDPLPRTPAYDLAECRMELAGCLAQAGPACGDGVDNDGDGLVDHDSVNATNPDVGCSSASDTSEKDQSGAWPCDDGVSNEASFPGETGPGFGCAVGQRLTSAGCQALPSDGLADLADPGCGLDATAGGPRPPSPTPADYQSGEFPQCQDGLENDLDGKVDYDCGASTNAGVCAKICVGGGAGFAGFRCTSSATCNGGSCDFVIADTHCTGALPATDKKEVKACGIGFELALLLPALGLVRFGRRRAARASVLAIGLAAALPLLGSEAHAVCTPGSGNSGPPLFLNDGGSHVINTDVHCGRQVVVANHPTTKVPTTLTVQAGAVFGEAADTDLTAPLGLLVSGKSTASVTGGTIMGVVESTDDATLTITGGTIERDVEASGRSKLVVNGGTLNRDLQVHDTARAELRAGTLTGGMSGQSRIELLDPLGTAGSWLQIYGNDIQVNGSIVANADVPGSTGSLDGILDGLQTLDVDFAKDPGGRLTIVDNNPGPGNSDGDTLVNPVDVCPTVTNQGQEDVDRDWIGDACDPLPNTPAWDLARCIADLGHVNSTLGLGCLSESGAACSDGVDNDGDGLTDHSSLNPGIFADVGCASAGDTSEKDQTGTWKCDDAVDNEPTFAGDGGCPAGQRNTPAGCQVLPFDTLIDLDDPACALFAPSTVGEFPQCQDGLENDADLRVDFDCGRSTNGDVCAKVCDGPASNTGFRCTTNGQCPGGSCIFSIGGDPHCTGTFPAFDNKELKPDCGIGFELALLLPVLYRLRERRRAARA